MQACKDYLAAESAFLAAEEAAAAAEDAELVPADTKVKSDHRCLTGRLIGYPSMRLQTARSAVTRGSKENFLMQICNLDMHIYMLPQFLTQSALLQTLIN